MAVKCLYVVLLYLGGDHTESIQLQYDPSQISFNQLLSIFWSLHDPTEEQKRQYKSVIFVHSEQQRKLAQASLDRLQERKHGLHVLTTIENASQFFDAEPYHQKYRLRNNDRLFHDLRNFSNDELRDSFVAARLNGLAAGEGTKEIFLTELDQYELSSKTEAYVRRLVTKLKQ